jgi:multisubunit Na+/H+ antiporter MnhF subunit
VKGVDVVVTLVSLLMMMVVERFVIGDTDDDRIVSVLPRELAWLVGPK